MKIKNLIGLMVGASLIGCGGNDTGRYPIQGELMHDYLQDSGNGMRFYRVFVNINNGMVTYPIIGDSSELARLENEFVSREDSGIRGDWVGINPKSNIFSLDEVILTTDKIKKLRGGSE